METKSEKKSVPWKGWEVLLFLVIWFVAQIVCGIMGAVVGHFASPSQPLEPSAVMEQKDHGHPIAQLIEYGKNSPVVLLVAFFVGVVVAPLIEEFLFRLLLQGWLEAKLSHYRIPCASGVAIVTASFFFALLHTGDSDTIAGQVLFFMFAFSIVSGLLITALGITYLVLMRNVRKTDLFGTEPFFRPRFFTLAGYCFVALLFIYGISGILDWWYPTSNTDPIPIFFFSLLLGTLYSKTQNIAYCILLHACLNATSLTIVWLTV